MGVPSRRSGSLNRLAAPAVGGGISAELPVVAISFSGVAATAKHAAALPVGGVTFAGVAPSARHSASLPVGSVTLAGITLTAKHSAALPAVTVTLAAAAIQATQGGKTFYLKEAAASGSNHASLQDGGTPPAAATTGTGWTVGTTAIDQTSYMARGVERAASTFAGASAGDPDNTLGDCFRTESRLTGTFAAGTWTLTVPLIAVTSGGDQDVRLTVYVWRIASETTGAGLLLSASTTDVTNLTTSTAQDALLEFSLGQTAFNDQHLFVQIRCDIRGAGGASTRDVLIRVGSGAGLATPAFSPGMNADLPAVTLTLAAIAPTSKHAAAAGIGTITLAGVSPAARHSAAAGGGVITLAAVAPAATKRAAAGVGTITFTAGALSGSGEHLLPVAALSLASPAPATAKRAPLGIGTLTLTAGAFATGVSAAAGVGTMTFSAISPLARKRAALPAGVLSLLAVRPTTIGGLGAKFPDACTVVDVGLVVGLVDGVLGVALEG